MFEKMDDDDKQAAALIVTTVLLAGMLASETRPGFKKEDAIVSCADYADRILKRFGIIP